MKYTYCDWVTELIDNFPIRCPPSIFNFQLPSTQPQKNIYMFHNHPLELLVFFFHEQRLWLEQSVLEILWKRKTKGLLCCDEAFLSRDWVWAWRNLSHSRRPTIQQTLPSQTYYCTRAHYSCGESHLGVKGNKCFFNWNTGISSCFLPMLYESPVPIV